MVSGIETVKSMAVEPQVTRRWDNQLAAYVSAGFKVANLANIGSQGQSYSKNCYGGHHVDGGKTGD